MQRTLTAASSLLVVSGACMALAQTPTPPSAQAQAPAAAGELRGKIVDANRNTPIARASAVVRQKDAPTILAGAIADADGAFRIQGLRPGAYVLRATYLGYAPLMEDFIIAPTSPIVDVGSVKLSQVAVSLSAVAVTEGQTAVTVESDRNAYRAKDIAPAAANASELLDNVPGVQADADGKISFRGNDNVVVQINGRATPLRGTQLASYLKSLPASVVDRVEVIPNPSAKYDPEGMAGIINIALKQKVDVGLSGGLNAGVSTVDRYNSSGNLGYQSGPWTSFVNGGGVSDKRSVVGINDRERYDAVRTLLSATDQDVASTPTNRGQNLNATVDYKLTPRDVLSNALSINHRSSGEAEMNAYSELSGAGSLLDRYDRPRNMSVRGWMVDYDVSLKRTFEPRKHELSGEVRFNRAHDQDFTALWLQPAGLSSARRQNEEDDNDAVSKQVTGQLDYVKTFKPRTKLETGVKSNERRLDRSFLVAKDSLGTGIWARGSLSNDFGFDEAVHAAYAVVSQGASKFDLQGGLRAEYATRNFTMAEPAKSYPYNYASLFPSSVVMVSLDDMTRLKASYSRRIRRPGSPELNPFPTLFDVQNVFIGNPNLSPEYTDAFELGMTKNMSKGMVQLSPFYRHTSHIIRIDINTADTFDGREVTSFRYKNLATGNSWGTDLNGQLLLGSRFNGFAGFNLFKMVTDGGSTSAVGSDAVAWMGRVNGTSELTKTLVLQASYFYRAPVNIEHGQVGRKQMANIALRKKIDGDNSSITLQINDPFNTGSFRVRAADDRIIQLTERRFGTRAVFVAFQYDYGRPPRVRQVQPDQSSQGGGFPP